MSFNKWEFPENFRQFKAQCACGMLETSLGVEAEGGSSGVVAGDAGCGWVRAVGV